MKFSKIKFGVIGLMLASAGQTFAAQAETGPGLDIEAAAAVLSAGVATREAMCEQIGQSYSGSSLIPQTASWLGAFGVGAKEGWVTLNLTCQSKNTDGKEATQMSLRQISGDDSYGIFALDANQTDDLGIKSHVKGSIKMVVENGLLKTSITDLSRTFDAITFSSDQSGLTFLDNQNGIFFPAKEILSAQ